MRLQSELLAFLEIWFKHSVYRRVTPRSLVQI
jgi:hypothetical protein